jgi:C4-dicarboxylate-specific signal transduction histidine kinase
VRGERILLVQVFLNLIFNAMDAVAEVPMSERVVKISCRIQAEGEWVEVSVQDRGPGVDPGLVEKIFDYYYTTKKQGLGLGLAISKYIIKEHNGSIEVTATGERGACFTVRLPAQNGTS